MCFSSYIVIPFFKTRLSIFVISSRMLIIVSLKCSVSCLAFVVLIFFPVCFGLIYLEAVLKSVLFLAVLSYLEKLTKIH